MREEVSYWDAVREEVSYWDATASKNCSTRCTGLLASLIMCRKTVASRMPPPMQSTSPKTTSIYVCTGCPIFFVRLAVINYKICQIEASFSKWKNIRDPYRGDTGKLKLLKMTTVGEQRKTIPLILNQNTSLRPVRLNELQFEYTYIAHNSIV